jgi:hypothetical protein
VHSPLAEGDRLCDGVRDARTQGGDLRTVGGADEHQKLVPTDAGNQVVGTDAEPQPLAMTAMI